MYKKLVVVFFCCLAWTAFGQTESANTLIINADLGEHIISKHIYGHFSEHLGRCIYGGIWVGRDSDIPNTDGVRNDVIAALRKIKIPNLRWPGGCFADEYHWMDGIGPAAERPKMINTHWGGVVEDNSFGTHEFLNFCEQLGTEPYISANVGSGTVQEMSDWVEYVNSDADGPMANLRRQNGRDKPWSVRFWGVGNENWGCGGDMTPEYYSDLYRRYARYCRNHGENRLFKIACGASDYNYNWTDVLMNNVGRRMHGLSLHYYTVKGWRGSKGSATQFNRDEYFNTLVKCLDVENVLDKHITIMDKYDPDNGIGLMLDEWGAWWDVEPGTNRGFLYQQNTLRDAFVAALTLNIFNKRCERLKMANLAQTVNVLQALILTRDEKMLVTPTYHVFDLFKVHQDATLLPAQLKSVDYLHGGEKLPALSASCSRAVDGSISVTIVNVNPDDDLPMQCEVRGAAIKQVSAKILTADSLDAHNTFEQPDKVKVGNFNELSVNNDLVDFTIPAKSILLITMK